MQNTIVKEYKKVKDPVYGYIPIEVKYIRNIIDTPMFQRLRRVSKLVTLLFIHLPYITVLFTLLVFFIWDVLLQNV